MLCWQAHFSLWDTWQSGLRPRRRGQEEAEAQGLRGWVSCAQNTEWSPWSTGSWSYAIPTRPGPEAQVLLSRQP